MASAYIQKLQDMDGNDIYPMTVADAVYVQTSSGSTVSQQKLTDKLADMENSFQVGCNTLVSKLEELGITPSSSSPTDIAVAIQTACSTYYNKGVAAADARVNKSSASYSQGVADADARVNTSSASYQQGYSTGYSAGAASADTSAAYNNGYNAGVAAADARVNTSSASYKQGSSDGIAAVQANPGNYNLTTHGSSTQYFQAAYDGGNVTLRRTTGGLSEYMGSFYISEDSWGDSGQYTGSYTYSW